MNARIAVGVRTQSYVYIYLIIFVPIGVFRSNKCQMSSFRFIIYRTAIIINIIIWFFLFYFYYFSVYEPTVPRRY